MQLTGAGRMCTPGLPKAPGYETIPYFPPEQGMRERDHIDDWSVSQSMVPSKVMFRDYDFTKPKTDLSSKNSNPFKHPMVIKEPEIYDYPGEYTETRDGADFARHRMESLAAQHERIVASGNAKGIAVGNLFKLQDFPKKSENNALNGLFCELDSFPS